LLAFTFPGQGSQRPGMGAPWVDHPSWELVADASRATGRDVAHLLLEAGADELTQTRNSQLATFVLSLVVLDAVERLGIGPALVAGHSLGEYSALVACGALSFEEGCRIVVERGEGMQQSAEDQPGTMYAVLGLDDEQVDVACRRADGEAWVANYNAPGQVVIAGSPEALERAAAIAKELGAKRAVKLPVGGAFHTPYMASARDRLRKALDAATFRDPEVPLVANVDALPHDNGNEWPQLSSAQLCSPVRWRQSVDQLLSMGATTLIELGAGNVLSGLAKRITPDTRAISVSTPDELDQLVHTLAHVEETAAPEETTPQHEGEHLFVHERLVVSTATGLFAPIENGVSMGETIDVGAVVGLVGDKEVRTPFAGQLMGVLTIPGERVTVGQPVAWLRAETAQ
jgi:[acyl-carrier-protein] S-malonyltransferase